MRRERLIAGLRCSEVIARLDGYVAGTLAEEERRAVVAHVSACPLCEDFGGRYGATIASIRRVHDEAELPAEAKDRLLEKLAGLR